jgi:hypothetical protein
VDFFGIVTFAHDIKMRSTGSVGCFQEFFSMMDIIYRILGDLQTIDNIVRSVDGD